MEALYLIIGKCICWALLPLMILSFLWKVSFRLIQRVKVRLWIFQIYERYCESTEQLFFDWQECTQYDSYLLDKAVHTLQMFQDETSSVYRKGYNLFRSQYIRKATKAKVKLTELREKLLWENEIDLTHPINIKRSSVGFHPLKNKDLDETLSYLPFAKKRL